MKLYDLKSFYIVTDIKEHQQNKQKLLDLIDEMPESFMEDGIGNKISKTDWNLSREHKREYVGYFYNMISPYMSEMAELLKCKKWDIVNGWFQIYENANDVHLWHVHNNVNYTNVYYLHLPDNSIKTEIYDVTNDNIIDDLKVKEGQILTFPASIIHRAPINKTNDKKIIISFNTNFDAPNL